MHDRSGKVGIYRVEIGASHCSSHVALYEDIGVFDFWFVDDVMVEDRKSDRRSDDVKSADVKSAV